MGEWADEALNQAIVNGWFDPEPRGRKQKRRDRQRAAKATMRNCRFCNKYPLFFHEERPHVWILAEWNEENKPVRHVCKLKERFNRVRF
jgi:hypothetical protein